MKRLYTVISSLVITASLLSFREMPHAMDTIAAAHVMRDGDTIVSPRGSFVMGFFSPGNSKNRYVGIWYNTVSVLTAVWVANREAPLTNTSGVLKFIKPGILVLVNESNAVIWSTNTSSPVKAPVAQLLDSGNLVVKEANDDNDPKNFLWQSFDHPTDTLLPGMKLGWNYAAHVEFYLSSWRSYDDPASGDYTYHCDPTGYPQNVLRKGRDKRYSTGPWNGLTFSGLPGLRRNPVFKFGLVMNKNEVYYHYELINTLVISRFTLSETGVGQRWGWNDQTQSWQVYLTAPTDNCDFYNLCGSYGVCSTSVCGCLNKFMPEDEESWDKGIWSGGCVRRTPLKCQSDGFLKNSGIKLPDTEHSWYIESMNLEGCKKLCFENCSCTAYTIIDVTTCLLWFSDLVDIKELSADGQDIYIRMAASEIESIGRRRKIAIVVVGLVATTLVLLCIGLILYFHCQRRRKINLWLKKGGSLRREDVKDLDEENRNKDLELPLFELSTISKATDNFSLRSKIGEGGFGPVYKGLLEDGQEIAVKRLSRTSLQGVNEFKNEVICVAKLQHRNLVKLLGCCICGEEYLLIYEYMPNRSLDLILFDPLETKLLDWPIRFHIINGIARGLLYLHQDSRLRIIHRDLKASNILLDADMNPKISDFGLARSFGGNETGANTSRVVGTYGYMSPEYAVDGLFSVKSDVFSFGVLVLEIVSGKRNRGFSHRDHYHNLLGHAWMLHKEGNTLELIKSYPIKPDYFSEVLRAIHVGLLCVQQSPEDRPTMSLVVLMLGNEGELPQPKKPGFFTERDVTDTETSISSLSALHSTNEMSITLLQAR